jgi:hypothetical protein
MPVCSCIIDFFGKIDGCNRIFFWGGGDGNAHCTKLGRHMEMTTNMMMMMVVVVVVVVVMMKW